MADLQDLFARLKSPEAGRSSPQSQSQYHHPSVSSPIFSPAPGGPQPHHQSAIMSPNTSAANTPAVEHGNPDRTASLLNLLKFNQPAASSDTAAPAVERRPSHNIVHGMQAEGSASRPVSASDLVASFIRKPSSTTANQIPNVTSPAPSLSSSAGAGKNPQDFLLKLLNQGKPSASDTSSIKHPDEPIPSIESDPQSMLAENLAKTSLGQADAPTPSTERRSSPIRVFGSEEPGQSNGFEAPKPTASKGLFNYVNPFEQLSASSPRNLSPKPVNRSATVTPRRDILKHDRDVSRSNSSPSAKNRKIPRAKSRSPPPLAEKVTPPSSDMSQALDEVQEQLEKQAEDAVAEVTLEGASKSKNDSPEAIQEAVEENVEDLTQAIHEAAVDMKHDLEDRDVRKAFEESMPKAMAQGFEGAIDQIAQENVADSWESADGDDGSDKKPFVVPVYNFPMRPFFSISIIKLGDPPVSIRLENLMEIVRLKKDFDQIDRNLVSATKTNIVYAMTRSSHGGFRVILQENGRTKHFFSNSRERIFNLGMCIGVPGSSALDAEAVLATGVNGTVFWTTVGDSNGPFAEEKLETSGVIFPPIPSQEDNTSGGQLKTRVKPSSRHPEFFGLGRGKAIYLVWPAVARLDTYTDPETRVCDSQKYLKERSAKIWTGKAGKDFTFSADDTVIASLDKAGKMKFWDIRELTAKGTGDGPFEPIDLKTPLLTFATNAPTDKSWPTSIMFVDKDKPCNRGIAQRYMVVGMKQNHTLQLWDLALGKAVQELNFPHENESDAICSVAYHPKTGILAVAHPTRNSIYFVHLSAPRYNLQAVSQAKYITMLNEGDKKLPKPESTAIMSGVRELSFASKGQIRSMEMLPEPGNADHKDTDMFELYIMHAKGLTMLTVNREDCGWTPDGKVIQPINAENAGTIVVKALKTIPIEPSTVPSTVNGDSPARPGLPPSSAASATTATPKKDSASRASHLTSRPSPSVAPTLSRVEAKQDAAREAFINGTEKADKKKKKRAGADTASQTSSAPVTSSSSYAMAARAKPEISSLPSPAPELNTSASSTTEPKPSQPASQPVASDIPEWAARLLSSSAVPTRNMAQGDQFVPAETSQAVKREIEALYRRLDDDKRVADAAGAAKQDAILRLVSSTLTENVERTLTGIISTNIRDVLPSLTNTIGDQITRELTGLMHQSVKTELKNEVKVALPAAVTRALQDPDVLRVISENVQSKITTQMERLFASAIQQNNHASSAIQQMTIETERRIAAQMHQMEAQRQADAVKIEQLTNLVTRLSQSVNGMAGTVNGLAATLSDVQRGQVKLLEQQQYSPARDGSSPSSRTSTVQAGASAAQSPLDKEIAEITRLLSDGQVESGIVNWLHSQYQGEVFDRLFTRVNPNCVQELAPLITLSVGAAVTASLDKNLPERLSWLEGVFANIDRRDADLNDVIPKVMPVLSGRLQKAYMELAHADPANVNLSRLYNLNSHLSQFIQS